MVKPKKDLTANADFIVNPRLFVWWKEDAGQNHRYSFVLCSSIQTILPQSSGGQTAVYRKYTRQPESNSAPNDSSLLVFISLHVAPFHTPPRLQDWKQTVEAHHFCASLCEPQEEASR